MHASIVFAQISLCRGSHPGEKQGVRVAATAMIASAKSEPAFLLPSLARSLSMSVILSASPSSMTSTYPNHPCSSVSKVLAFRLLSFLRLSLSPLPHHPHKHTKASDLTLVGSRKLRAQSTPGNAIWVRASSIVGPLLATSLESFFDLDPSTQPNFSPRS